MKKICIILFFSYISVSGIDILSTLLPEYKAQQAYIKGNYDMAKEVYTNFIESDPYNAQNNYNMGTVLYKQGRFQEARQYFQRACQQTQDSTLQETALFNQGNSFIKLKEYESAIEAYEKVLEINADNDRAQKNLKIAQQLLEEEQKKKEEQEKNNKDQQGDKNTDSQSQQDNTQESKNNEKQDESSGQQRNEQQDNKEKNIDKQKENTGTQGQNSDKDEKKQEEASEASKENSKQDSSEQNEIDKQSNDQSGNKEKDQPEQEQQGANPVKEKQSEENKKNQQRESAEQKIMDQVNDLQESQNNDFEKKTMEPKQLSESEFKDKVNSTQGEEAVELQNQYAEQMDADVTKDNRLDQKDVHLLKLLSQQEDSIHKQLLKMNVSKKGSEKYGQKNW